MNIPHPLGVIASSQAALEAVGPDFIKTGVYQARDQAKIIFEKIRAELFEGMTEEAGRKLALKISMDYGIKRHWHTPHVRFGKGTLLNFNDHARSERKLVDGDACFIDLGPVWEDTQNKLAYEGDYGDSFVYGENPDAERCVQACRQLFQEAKREWRKNKTTGEAIYTFLKNRSLELGYELLEEVGGHRVSDFPHHRYSKSNLSELSFIPSDSLWILEVQILDPNRRFGAFFEDILD